MQGNTSYLMVLNSVLGEEGELEQGGQKEQTFSYKVNKY